LDKFFDEYDENNEIPVAEFLRDINSHLTEEEIDQLVQEYQNDYQELVEKKEKGEANEHLKKLINRIEDQKKDLENMDSNKLKLKIDKNCENKFKTY